MTTTRHEITYQPLDQLQPHPANPKDHDVGAVISSIHRFGIAGPIIVDQRTGYILAGHGRVKALKAIRDDGGTPPEGVTVADDPDNAGEWVVPVMDSWASRTDYDAHAAMIALNRTTELGGWDQTALVDLLEQLAEYDDGLDGVGYDGDDLDTLKAQLAYLDEPDNESELDSDESERIGLALLDVTLPDPSHTPTEGDMYKLGDHLLAVADVLNGHTMWAQHLNSNTTFLPYAGLYAPLSIQAESRELLMVQPDPYVCGLILDKWTETGGTWSKL